MTLLLDATAELGFGAEVDDEDDADAAGGSPAAAIKGGPCGSPSDFVPTTLIAMIPT